MGVDVLMPQMGESIFEGTITKWLKKPGDEVQRDEPLFEISTDKVDAEIPAPAAGILREIKFGEGKTVPIQTVVAVIDVPGAETGTDKGALKTSTRTEAAPAGSPPAPSVAPAVKDVRGSRDAKADQAAPARDGGKRDGGANAGTGAVAEATGAADQARGAARVRSSPLVRRLAAENKVDLRALRGTGAGGRISKRDIMAAISGAAQPVPSGDGSAEQVGLGGTSGGTSGGTPAESLAGRVSASVPARGGQPAHGVLETAVPRERIYFGRYDAQSMSVMRQRIAEHMVLSKRVSPHVYSIDEADMTHIGRVRAEAKEEFEKRYDTKLTFMAFFLRACVAALREFPTVNASTDGANVVLHGEINVGIAVALDWGLIVPVLKHAEDKNFLGLQRDINDLAERARTKKLRPEEVQESTFSVTNPGIFGGLMGLPIINQPNVAILGIGAIQKRAVVVDDAIAIRSMVYLTLSYDHRVVDGAVAHRFMGQVKERLEGWKEDIL